MRYAAVVLYYRLGDAIHGTLDALNRQDRPPERIVLVDNASGDGVLDSLGGRYPNLVLVRMETNVGYAGGMNQGALLTPPDVDAVLFLTHEVRLEPDCLTKLIGALEQKHSVGMVGPALRLSDGETPWSFGGVVTKTGEVRHITDAASGCAVDWLDGACLLVRAALLAACDGFDEDFFLYWEDVDFSLRIARHASIECVTSAVAYQDTATAPIYLRTRNQILCWRKHRQNFWLAMATGAAIARMLLLDIWSGSRSQVAARFLGVVHGFTGALAPKSILMFRSD